jgi:hypothetical protein
VKKKFLFYVIGLPMAVTGLYARKSPVNTQSQSSEGSVVAVSEQRLQSNYVGDNPSDAPLQPEVHSYDVTVRVNCLTYVGHYNSEFDYLPSVLTTGRKVEVRAQRHLIYISVPGEDEYKMAIVGHPHFSSTECHVDQ